MLSTKLLNLPSSENAYEDPSFWRQWEEGCSVSPVRVGLLHLNKPLDIAQIAAYSLSTSQGLPHLGLFLMGGTLDIFHHKVVSKVTSWSITRESLALVPRRNMSLGRLRGEGYRLVGTIPHIAKSENFYNFTYGENDVYLVGGANGLSKESLEQCDATVHLPSSPRVPFLTASTVVPLITSHILSERGLWP